MPSSTFNSKASPAARGARGGAASPRGLERPVPTQPWLRTLAVVACATLIGTTGWEIAMRQFGLRAGDLDDGKAHWAVERRKVDEGPRDPIVIIGDSRILFDTDLATWQTLSGRRPIQLALVGTSARPFLHDLAMDDHFAGLLVIGIAEQVYFRERAGLMAGALDYIRNESPSQRLSHRIYVALSRYVAFLDSRTTLLKLLEQRDWPERPGVDGPYLQPWKLSEAYDDRQTRLWPQIESNFYLREHARRVWLSSKQKPPTPEMIDRMIATSKADIDRIRARGGEVVWIRPPSAGPLRDAERSALPRDKVWDRLLRDSGSFGVHFEDYPQMQNLNVPEWSHLSEPSALIFTDAYVRVLLDHVDWLKAHDNAGPIDERTRHH